MIPLFKVFMSKNVGDSLLQTIYSGMITQGERVEEFESKLGNMFSYPYILTLNSATSGLTMALRMIKDDFESKGIHFDKDDEVLSTPLTCMASNVPILANNLKVRWVDVDKNTGMIDLDDLESKINTHTKIIIVVHWGGYPVDLDKLSDILDRKEKTLGFRPQVLEDCAHAFLSEYKGRKIGTTGNFAVFSLQAIKHLTTGDGGLIFCPTKELYEKAKLLRWYGIDRAKRNYKGKDFRLEADVTDWGYKFHMNDINATIGLQNLPHVEENIQKIRKNAEYFDTHIRNEHIKIVQPFGEQYKSSYWLYTIFVSNKAKFIEYMKEHNIMVSQVHQRNDIHTCFNLYQTSLPNLDFVETTIICIPVGWWLSDTDRENIVQAINAYTPS